MKKIVMVIVAHDDALSLADTVQNVRHFCPQAELYLYNSGDDPTLGADLEIQFVPSPRRLYYAKVTPFFFDMFEWLVNERIKFDYAINLETDMLFIRKGFEAFISEVMRDCDYMAPRFARFTSGKSRWRPIRSLRPELPQWFKTLGVDYTHEGFSPGQVFSKKYVEKLLHHAAYPEIRRLLKENQSYTLQEVLFPTLVDALKLCGQSYPTGTEPHIRYRPYHALRGVKRALALPDAYFIHPVRREMDNPARVLIRSLMDHQSG
jgi:hypothetical protein